MLGPIGMKRIEAVVSLGFFWYTVFMKLFRITLLVLFVVGLVVSPMQGVFADADVRDGVEQLSTEHCAMMTDMSGSTVQQGMDCCGSDCDCPMMMCSAAMGVLQLERVVFSAGVFVRAHDTIVADWASVVISVPTSPPKVFS